MLGLRKLERAETPPQPKTVKTPWTIGHGLIFIGVVVVLLAVGVGGYLVLSTPADPFANFTPGRMEQVAENATPLQSVRLWRMLEKSGLEHHKTGIERDFEDRQAGHQVLWWVWAPFPITGLALVAAGMIVLKLRKKKTMVTARNQPRRA